MKSKINNKNEFHDLAKHIKENKSYNVTILEAKVRETGFTDKQLEQLAALLAPIKQDIAELKQDMIGVKKDIVDIKRDIVEIKSLPTIAKELKEKNK